VAHRIVMPSFGMYTAEGKLTRWLRPTGSRVEAGESIVEIETEKAVHEIVAPAAGVLHPVAHPEETLAVEALIGYVLAEGESAPLNSERINAGGNVVPAAANRIPAEAKAREIRATPIAKRLASEHNIDLSLLTGSGPSGRIIEADVRSAIDQAGAIRAEPMTVPAQSTRVIRERIPLTGMRRAINERLRYGFEEAVPLTLTRKVRTEALQRSRSRLAENGLQVSYDALFIKALAMALRQDSRLNASVQGDSICVYDSIDVGFAVAVAGGLLVPVVRKADSRPLGEIEQAVRNLSETARAGRLLHDDMVDGTITVTNLGAYGVDAFTPVLNPPQAAILGIGRILKEPVLDEDVIVSGSSCVLSLTFDHRVCDGAPAAQLLAAVVNFISDEQQLVASA
jgi:pyruvate dehydrogenase E2 component (dihydrolipoamide acetyltransferase)